MKLILICLMYCTYFSLFIISLLTFWQSIFNYSLNKYINPLLEDSCISCYNFRQNHILGYLFLLLLYWLVFLSQSRKPLKVFVGSELSAFSYIGSLCFLQLSRNIWFSSPLFRETNPSPPRETSFCCNV